MTDIPKLAASASRILYAQGVLDAFGHVSVRDPDGRDGFWMSKSMAPGLVTPADVYFHNQDGDLVDGNGARPFLERFIHAEIYRARPDVNGIVHSHSLSVIPFTVVADMRLRPVCHMCSFLHGAPSPFEISDFAGDATDLLIRSRALGVELARHLGDESLVLMRGHGFTTVGETVEEAVFRAVWTEKGAALQSSALALGSPRFLSEGEAKAATATNRGQIGRAWNLWLSEVDFNTASR